jgi:urease accessory protein
VCNADGRSLLATEHRGPLRVQKALDIGREDGLAVYLWAWAENQVLVAVKSVPLGQMVGQRLLAALHPAIDAAVRSAVDCPADALGRASVQYAINSARHEAMYSRLYRS